jgi:hypothetical protein
MTAPCEFTREENVEQATPNGARASPMAFAARLQASSPTVRANRAGPEPEMLHPSAPASRAAFYMAAKPLIVWARAGSAMTSCKDLPIRE